MGVIVLLSPFLISASLPKALCGLGNGVIGEHHLFSQYLEYDHLVVYKLNIPLQCSNELWINDLRFVEKMS